MLRTFSVPLNDHEDIKFVTLFILISDGKVELGYWLVPGGGWIRLDLFVEVDVVQSGTGEVMLLVLFF